jgi:integrase/recombinase XerD
MGKRKAPAGCFWRNDTIWARTQVRGREHRWSLHTSDPAVARARYKTGRERLIGDAHHGDSPRTFVEAMEGWAPWIERRAGAKTVQRYACSLDQLRLFVEGKRLSEINGRLTAEIIRARTADGVSNATIKRDLVALSSVLNYAIDEGWLESNPVLARMKRVKERREPIMLPRQEDIDLVVDRAPGMIKQLIRIAMATGARQDELLRARRDDVDHDRRQLTVTGKRNKRRTIALDPFQGYDLLRALPAYVGSPLLFWHSGGTRYQNFSSQFAAIVSRTAAWAKASATDFRPFPIPRSEALACCALAQVRRQHLRATAPARPHQREDDRGLFGRGLSDLRRAGSGQGRHKNRNVEPLKGGQSLENKHRKHWDCLV